MKPQTTSSGGTPSSSPRVEAEKVKPSTSTNTKSSTFARLSLQNLFKKSTAAKQDTNEITASTPSSIAVNASERSLAPGISNSISNSTSHPVIATVITATNTNTSNSSSAATNRRPSTSREAPITNPDQNMNSLPECADNSTLGTVSSVERLLDQQEQPDSSDTGAIDSMPPNIPPTTTLLQEEKASPRFPALSAFSHAAGVVASPFTWMFSKSPKTRSGKKPIKPSGATGSTPDDPSTASDAASNEPVETENQKLDRLQREAAASNPKLLESYKQEVENQLLAICGVCGLLFSIGHMLKVLIANEFIYSQFDANEFLQVVVSIVAQLMIVSFFGHRILGYLAGAALRFRFKRRQRNVLGNKNPGLYDIHFGWLSIRLGFDRSQIIFHNIVWRNPPAYNRTPYFLYIHDLTFTINFPRFAYALYTRDPVPIDLVVFDGVEVHMERNDSNEMLNFWYAVGKRTPEEEKIAFAAFLKDAVEKMKRRMKEDMAERFIQISELIPFMKHTSQSEGSAKATGSNQAPTTSSTAPAPATDKSRKKGTKLRKSTLGVMDFVHKIEHLFPRHREEDNLATSPGPTAEHPTPQNAAQSTHTMNDGDEDSEDDESDEEDEYVAEENDLPASEGSRERPRRSSRTSIFSNPFASSAAPAPATTTLPSPEKESEAHKAPGTGRRKSKAPAPLEVNATAGRPDSLSDSHLHSTSTSTAPAPAPAPAVAPPKKELLIDLQRAVFINFFINPIDAFTPYHVYNTKGVEARIPILLVKHEQVTLKSWTQKGVRIPVPPRRVCGKLGDSVVGGVVVHNRTAAARYFAAYTRHTTLKETFTWTRFRQTPTQPPDASMSTPADTASMNVPGTRVCTCGGAGTCSGCGAVAIDTNTSSVRRSKGTRRKTPPRQNSIQTQGSADPKSEISVEDQLAMNLHFQGK